tara:strand:+ start:12364 stop:12975 length:612 start_codon:yes stop_codon:yes gene_type:complete
MKRGSVNLPVMESFYSIQGEGYHSGKPAYFVRLAGCDVKCTWCDVKDSWSSTDDQFIHVKDIVNEINKHPTDLIIITGGEPFCHDLGPLTKLLKEEGKLVHVETSGTEKFTGTFDWICLSPKRFKKPLEKYYQISDELKVIIYQDSDFRWAERISSKMKKDTQRILQPEWSVEKKANTNILNYIKKNPSWRISLQTHKYLKVD